jgi:hypothetical protein
MNPEEDIGRDILRNELIPITCEILDSLVKLELFWVLEEAFS